METRPTEDYGQLRIASSNQIESDNIENPNKKI